MAHIAASSPIRIHFAGPMDSRTARALSATSGPTPAGSPIVIAILGRLTDPPGAEVERVDERIALAEAAGLGDNNTAVGIASLDKAPWHARGQLATQTDR